MTSLFEKFRIEGKVIVITGGAGLIGRRHTEAVLEGGGIPVLLDIFEEPLKKVKEQFLKDYPEAVMETLVTDITKKEKLEEIRDILLKKYGHIDGLINNAANNPKMEGGSNNMGAIQFHNLPLDIWNDDIAVGLTGAFLCAQVFGTVMEQQGKGVVINVASDYGIISPDQRVYRKEGIPEEEQIIKPVSYSVVKHGLIGMTKYLATYWAKKGVRVNTLCPASLENGQDPEFIQKLSDLIPMGRMSKPEEYPATVLYMLSEASSYMTGATVLLDGGRTIW
ncbi:MAG: SDR family oxidoreductase [Roseburia sp.]|nr:SDR family oxidoreductase [Roseburia sp.]MCM1278269.1 SDR family oxidoreductase [Robinsoniella sp.]